MAVPYTFGTATASIPLSQLDSNFATVITLGNTAIQLGNTVTTLNNMTLANVTISSGNVTLTNVAVTTANVTTANITTAVIGTETVTTSTITSSNITTANITTANITTDNITSGTVSTSLTLSYGTANAVAYLNGSKVVTTGSALTFDGTNFVTTGTATATKLIPTGTSVTGNGMYLPATNAVGISTNGTNAVYIDANQNVGIGTSSPAVKLDVSGQLNAQNFTSASTFGFKNRIINGGMVIDQRNAGASVSPPAAAQTFTLDRWAFYNSTATNRFSVQQTPSTTETGYAVRVAAGFTNYLATTVTSAYTPSGSDQQIIQQATEGFNIADFAWGTASAATVTLSFWVRSSLTGTHSGALRNANGFTRSYPFTFTINTANTWEQKSITVAGDTGGTYNSNNSGGIQVAFNLGSGSSSLGTAGVWNTTNAYTGATGSVQVSATNGATFYITGVQLEKGSTATSFDFRDYGTELMLCQRYYELSTTAGNTSLFRWYGGVGTELCTVFPMKVSKRAAPTITGGTITEFNCSSTIFSDITIDSYRLVTNSTALGVASFLFSSSFKMSAEL